MLQNTSPPSVWNRCAASCHAPVRAVEYVASRDPAARFAKSGWRLFSDR